MKDKTQEGKNKILKNKNLKKRKASKSIAADDSKPEKSRSERKQFNFNDCRLRKILIFLISFFVFFTLLMFFIYLIYGDDVLSATKIEATINVDDYIGFNLDKDKLHFGTAFPGGKSMRELSIISNEGGYFYATVDSEFKDWAFVSIQNEYIEKGTNIPFQITMVVPENTQAGNYTFEINLFILEKKADFITKSILKSAPANYKLESAETAGSGKIILDVVNSSTNY